MLLYDGKIFISPSLCVCFGPIQCYRIEFAAFSPTHTSIDCPFEIICFDCFLIYTQFFSETRFNMFPLESMPMWWKTKELSRNLAWLKVTWTSFYQNEIIATYDFLESFYCGDFFKQKNDLQLLLSVRNLICGEGSQNDSILWIEWLKLDIPSCLVIRFGYFQPFHQLFHGFIKLLLRLLAFQAFFKCILSFMWFDNH